MKKISNKESGFTLVELLVTITLGITMATVGFTTYQGFKARKDVELTTAEIAAAIESTRQRSVTQEDGSAWGIRFNNVADGKDNYQIFKGSVYATSSVVSLNSLRSAISFLNFSDDEYLDISFTPITGRPSSSETIFISKSTGTDDVGKIIVGNLGSVTQDVVPSYDYGLSGYWSFDEGEGGVAVDGSGNGNDATLHGGPTWEENANCIINECISFDGVDDYVSVGYEDKSILQPNEITISVWSYNSSGILFMHGEPVNRKTSGYGLYVNYFRLITDSGEIASSNFGSSIPENEWALITVTWDSNEMNAYVNGENVYSNNSVSGNIIYNTGRGTDNFFMHNHPYASSIISGSGLSDDVRVYNRALSASEVKRMYNDFK